jgi:hypothetical protein
LREEGDLFRRELVTLGLLETFEDGGGISVGEVSSNGLSNRVGTSRLDAREKVGLTLLERGSDGFVVRGIDLTRKNAVDNVEASLAVERGVGSSETTKTVLLGETTAETPVEVAERE